MALTKCIIIIMIMHFDSIIDSQQDAIDTIIIDNKNNDSNCTAQHCTGLHVDVNIYVKWTHNKSA